jgi:cellulose synthase/poly-beta-1,6-N-acetylglucosamine synthase-like glycosyltransferase
MLTAPSLPAFLLANGIPLAASRLLDALFDNTFVGIHHLEFFDWAILIPYFGVLIVLSFYGLHRYAMIRGYWKHRKELPERAPQQFADLPRVTVQLPIYNERYVIERLIEETC